MKRVSKLKNGMNLLTVPVSGTRAVTVLALFPVGSRYESPKISGASHFVEHLMFKGTGKRPTALHISRELDAAGADYNAFTYKDYTGYYIKVDSGKTELAFDMLSDMLFDSKLDPEEIERERGVIVEEIRMYDDNPTMAIDWLFDRVMFSGNPLGWDIAGTAETVKNISRADLWKYYRAAYRPENMALVVAGDIDEKKLKKLTGYFSGVKSPTAPGFKKDRYAKFAWPQKSPSLEQRVLVKEKKLDQSHVILGFPGLKQDHADRYAAGLLLTILGGGMSSRLFVEVREKRGLAYTVRAGGASFRDTGAVQIQTGLDRAGLAEALQVIKSELEKISREPVSAKELADAKSSVSGRMALAMEDSSFQAEWFAKQFWFSKKIESFEDARRKINSVTAGDLLRLARQFFNWKNLRLAAIGSKTKKEILKLI